MFHLVAHTCTGVENTKSIRFSQERPGTMQHISSCVLLPMDMTNMKYVIAIMHGTPKINDTKNAVRHLLISSLEREKQSLQKNSYPAEGYIITRIERKLDLLLI